MSNTTKMWMIGLVMVALAMAGGLLGMDRAGVSVIQPTLSLKDWQTFSGYAAGLNSSIVFDYPKEWTLDGPNGGDSFATVLFKDSDKHSVAWKQTAETGSPIPPGEVGMFRYTLTHVDAYPVPLAYDLTPQFTETERTSIIVDGRQGQLVTREVHLAGGEQRLELWALFPDVHSSVFEFMMRGDLYTNSYEVLLQLIYSINW